MTARNAPPVETPVVNYEEQVVLRVPLHIAEELRQMIRDAESSKKKQFPKRVAFALNSVPTGSASFALGDKKYEASLVNLPCVVESLKTLDKVSYYKSADIGQMLIVHDTEKGTGKPKKVHTDKDGTVSSGLVPAFKGIKRRFRQTHPSVEQVKEIEVELARVRGGPTDNVDIEVVEEEGEAYDVNAHLRDNDHVEIRKITNNGSLDKPKTPRKRTERKTKRRKTEAAESLDNGFDLAAELDSALGVPSIPPPSSSSFSSSEGPANPFADDRPFVSILPPEPLADFALPNKPTPMPPLVSAPTPFTQAPPPQPVPVKPKPQPQQKPATPTTPATPKTVQKPQTPQTPQTPSTPVAAPSPPIVSAAATTPLPTPPAQPLFSPPASMQPVFSAPQPVAQPPPLVSYLTNPQYLELSGQETSLNNEIRVLANSLEEMKVKAKAPTNPLVRSRLEQQAQKLQEQLNAKQKVLAEVVAKMDALRNT